MNRLFIYIFLFFSFFILAGCGSAIATVGSNDAKRAKMCKRRCDDDHYNIIIIRANGKIEKHKVNIISINKRMVCECIF